MRRRNAHGTVWLLAVGAAVACADDVAEMSSAAQLPTGAPLEIVAEPDLRLGVMEGDSVEEFDRVIGPFVTDDDRLVVPLAGPMLLRVFDLRGEHLVTLGGEGEGPGELMSISGAWARGNLIEVFDSDLRRVTTFHPDSAPRVIRLAAEGVAQSVVPRAFSEGWVTFGVDEVDPTGRDRVSAHLFGVDGTRIRELMSIRGMWRYRGEFGGGPVPLSPWAWFASGGERLFAADGLLPRIHVLDLLADSSRLITWEPTSEWTAREAFRRVSDSAVSVAPDDRKAMARARMDEAPTPELPVLGGLIVDALGFIWVRSYDPLVHSMALGGLGNPGPGGTWQIFASDGEPLPPVSLPPDLRPTFIGAERVVGVSRDALGVESVRVHALVRN